MFRLGTLVAIAFVLAAIPVSAGAVPPAPCHNAPQITDAGGDGHHPGTDVLAAWWSEASGHLQLTIQVRTGIWLAEHDDAEINGSGFMAQFFAGDRIWFLRARTPAQNRAQDPVVYDWGVVTTDSGLEILGATTGVTEPGAGGTVTLDVPAAMGITAGTKLMYFAVKTYDGIN